MTEGAADLTWPSGQRRHPLRDRIRFSPSQARAGRVLQGLTTKHVAALAGQWPRDVYMTADQVEAFELGVELDEVRYSALCHVLYNEGFGVIALQEGAGGEGVRFALPAEKRAEGTYSARRWKPVWEAMERRAQRLAEHEARMVAKHGERWWLDLNLSLEPLSCPTEQTDGQSDPDSAEGPCAP